MASWGGRDGIGSDRAISKPHGRSLWKKIMMGSQNFMECTRWKIPKGDKICFLEDMWIDEYKPKDTFPSIYAIAQDKSSLVQEMYSVRGDQWDWMVRLCRNLNDWEVVEYQELLILLSNFKLDNHSD